MTLSHVPNCQSFVYCSNTVLFINYGFIKITGTTKFTLGIYKQSEEVIEMYDEVGFLWKGKISDFIMTYYRSSDYVLC